jgi:acetylornithine deacetylase/succinyl-diaminopimelate desuccinylase-like protein
VKYLTGAMIKCRIKPNIKGSEGATTITFFQNKDIPAIATGFGAKGRAHTADEYVNINNLYKGALVLEEFLKNYRFS